MRRPQVPTRGRDCLVCIVVRGWQELCLASVIRRLFGWGTSSEGAKWAGGHAVKPSEALLVSPDVIRFSPYHSVAGTVDGAVLLSGFQSWLLLISSLPFGWSVCPSVKLKH